MWRAFFVTFLLASPATAQLAVSNFPYQGVVNPYNPYATSSRVGIIQSRPYVSLDRLHVERQSRSAPAQYGMFSGATNLSLSSYSRSASFGNYPHYPLLRLTMNRAIAATATSAKNLQPRPFTAPQPIEIGCDPYLDDNGCLDEYAGW